MHPLNERILKVPSWRRFLAILCLMAFSSSSGPCTTTTAFSTQHGLQHQHLQHPIFSVSHQYQHQLHLSSLSGGTVATTTNPSNHSTKRTRVRVSLRSSRPTPGSEQSQQEKDVGGADTSFKSQLFSAHAYATHETPVRWNDLLQSNVPLTCDADDKECLLLQHHYDESSMALDDTSSGQAQAAVHDHVTALDKITIGTFLTTMTMALAYLIKRSGPGAWRFYMAGGICAAASHIIPVPIDVVKTRKQCDVEYANSNFFQAFSSILKNEGFGGLWSGLGPTAVGYLMEGAIKFGVYEVLKPLFGRYLAAVAAITNIALFESRVLAFALSATISGMAASIMLCPMEALRIRMVANPSKKGSLATGYQMLKEEGVVAFTKSLMPQLYKQVPYTITKNVSFDYITRYSYAALLWWRRDDIAAVIGSGAKVVIPLCAAIVTSVLSCITSQPGDMVLSLVNAHSGDKRRTKDIVHDIWNSERGIGGFFVGTKTRFLHVGIIVTLQLTIYDFIKRLCGIAATGMH